MVCLLRRPPPYKGRDDRETWLASPHACGTVGNGCFSDSLFSALVFLLSIGMFRDMNRVLFLSLSLSLSLVWVLNRVRVLPDWVKLTEMCFRPVPRPVTNSSRNIDPIRTAQTGMSMNSGQIRSGCGVLVCCDLCLCRWVARCDVGVEIGCLSCSRKRIKGPMCDATFMCVCASASCQICHVSYI